MKRQAERFALLSFPLKLNFLSVESVIQNFSFPHRAIICKLTPKLNDLYSIFDDNFLKEICDRTFLFAVNNKISKFKLADKFRNPAHSQAGGSQKNFVSIFECFQIGFRFNSGFVFQNEFAHRSCQTTCCERWRKEFSIFTPENICQTRRNNFAALVQSDRLVKTVPPRIFEGEKYFPYNYKILRPPAARSN